MPATPSFRVTVSWLFVGVVYLILAIITANAYLHGVAEYKRATTAELIAFHAATPFQYRVLVPALMHMALRGGGSVIQAVFFTAVCSFTACLLAFFFLLREFLPARESFFLAPLILPALYWDHVAIGIDQFYYPGDILAVAFLALGLVAIITRRDALFYAVFCLATLNRETSLYLVLAYVLLNAGRMPGSRLAVHVGAQSVYYLAVKVVLGFIFRSNPGHGLFEWHLPDNLGIWLSVLEGHSRRYLLTYVSLFCGLYWLLPVYWKTRPPVAKRLLWIAVAEFAVMALVGTTLEMRIYDDALVVIALNACIAISQIAGSLPERAEPL